MTYWIAPSVSVIPTPEIIFRHVESVCDVTFEELAGKCRHRHIVDARHLANYFIKTYSKFLTLKEIGKLTNRDHSTVLHSLKCYNSLIATELPFKHKHNLIEAKIKQI